MDVHARTHRLLNGGTLGEHLGLSATQGVALQAASPAEADEPPDCADSMTSSTCPATGKWGATASSELLRLAKDVALGLHYLHANGVTHRDVKNANVMIDRGQTIQAKLCDFGISSLKSVRCSLLWRFESHLAHALHSMQASNTHRHPAHQWG